MRYLRFTPLGCKNVGIITCDFLAKLEFLKKLERLQIVGFYKLIFSKTRKPCFQVSVGSQTFDCNFGDCREIFMKLPDFAVHYAQHAGHTLHIPPDAAGKKVLNIPCPICGTVVPGLYKLQRHKMRHDPERKYKCPACCKQFVKANTLRKHISNVHRGEKAQMDEFIDCDKPVSPEPLLEGRVVTSHAIFAEYECATCGKLEDSMEKLKEHEIRNHSNIDSVQQQK